MTFNSLLSSPPPWMIERKERYIQSGEQPPSPASYSGARFGKPCYQNCSHSGPLGAYAGRHRRRKGSRIPWRTANPSPQLTANRGPRIRCIAKRACAIRWYVKVFLASPSNPQGVRGQDEFVRVSWDDALELIHRQHKRIRDTYGPASIFAGSYGWRSNGVLHKAATLLQRYMSLAGGYTGHLGDYSTGAAQAIMPYVVGSNEVYQQQTSWPLILEHSDVVVLWSANPLNTLKIALGTPPMSRAFLTLTRCAKAVSGSSVSIRCAQKPSISSATVASG